MAEQVKGASDDEIETLRRRALGLLLTPPPPDSFGQYAHAVAEQKLSLIARIDELKADLAVSEMDCMDGACRACVKCHDARESERDSLRVALARLADQAQSQGHCACTEFERCALCAALDIIDPEEAIADDPGAEESRERVTQDDVHDHRCRDAYCMGCVVIDDPSLTHPRPVKENGDSLEEPTPQPASVTPTRARSWPVRLVFGDAEHFISVSTAERIIGELSAELARLEIGGGEDTTNPGEAKP